MHRRARFQSGHLSIRTKLTVPYILLAVVVAVGGGYAVSQVALNSLEERFTQQLFATRNVASESSVALERDLLETLRLISHTQGLADSVRTRNSGRIAPLIYPIAFNSGDDAVLVLDRRGYPLVALLRSESTGLYDVASLSETYGQAPFVARVLHQEIDATGDKYSGILRVAGSEHFFVSGPVKDDAGTFFGAVLVGRSLNSVAVQVHDETLSHVTIYDLAHQPLASTFAEIPEAPQLDPASLLTPAANRGQTRDWQVGATAYKELMSPWLARSDQPVAVIGIALPVGFLAQTSGLTRFNITAITIVAALVATWMGITVSDSIRERILGLRKAATRVSNGDLGVEVAADGTDEVAALARSFNKMVADLSRSEKNRIAAFDRTIEGWSAALGMRDPGAEEHTRRVVAMSLAVARELNCDPQMLEHLRRGALLHDIGNMAIPDAILFKPTELTPDEWAILKRHPLYAREMLFKIEFLTYAMDVALFHHERWNGSGYPYGLADEMIPLNARIFAVVDVWEALTSDRPYRPAWTEQSALGHVCDNAGILFDPKVVRAFEQIYPEIRAIKRSHEIVGGPVNGESASRN